jgi:uncharacterized membrane-anchored protein YitT (DUF2179 family)
MKKAYSFILINIGIFLVATAIAIFKIPNEFVTGGVSGIAIIINSLLPSFSVGIVMLIINIILLIIGVLYVGFEFGAKTIYSTIVLSLAVWFLEKIYPIKESLTGDKMLELFVAILLLAAGSAILFYQNASSGGTDIIARIFNKKVHWHIGRALIITDFIICSFAVYVFGIKIGMYSLLGVIIKGFLIDAVIKGLHSSKQIIIISDKADQIKNFIMKDLQRGVTIYKAIGGNTNIERQVLNTIMNKKEALRLREYIMQIDNKAFVVSDNVADIYGKGFENLEL